MLAASHEGMHFLSWTIEDFTQVRQQSYTPKEPEDSRKLGSNTRQHMGHRWIRPGSMHWKLQPTGYQQKQDHKKEDGKSPHQCISCSAGPQREDYSLIEPTVPSSHTAEHSSHCFQHLLPSLQGPAVFILRSQCLFDHQLIGSGCDFFFNINLFILIGG